MSLAAVFVPRIELHHNLSDMKHSQSDNRSFSDDEYQKEGADLYSTVYNITLMSRIVKDLKCCQQFDVGRTNRAPFSCREITKYYCFTN